jgi:hypothetical protein
MEGHQSLFTKKHSRFCFRDLSKKAYATLLLTFLLWRHTYRSNYSANTIIPEINLRGVFDAIVQFYITSPKISQIFTHILRIVFVLCWRLSSAASYHSAEPHFEVYSYIKWIYQICCVYIRHVCSYTSHLVFMVGYYCMVVWLFR